MRDQEQTPQQPRQSVLINTPGQKAVDKNLDENLKGN